MAGRRSGRALMALVVLLAFLTGCGGRSAADSATADVQRLLDRRAAAVLDRDERAYERTGGGTDFAELRAVPVAAWSYRVTSVRRTGDTAIADAELRYRVAGYDRAPVTAGRTLRLGRDADGRWSVETDRPARRATQQLWDQGVVQLVRGRHALVLGAGQSGQALRDFADLADRAVPSVSDAWGTDWSRRVVVLVPKSVEGMAGLLGSPVSSYRGIAAVTTGETGAPARAPADRIIVNPDAFALLGGLGEQVVITHETTHVATRARTTAATPLWLSEGYADWVGYRAAGRTPVEAAPELSRAVREDRLPTALPDDEDFGFTGDASRLARSYESGWTACRLIADRWGESRLGEFYRAVGEHRQRAGAVQDALRKVLGTTPDAFTEDWRAYLRDQLG
ncbi:hypothetical protein ACFCXS_13515 [Streptomyces sp. NPDC056373]|uniref:hypothetical protein n=1 Tax=Streptomyces sp. NPDC056373 TaxID=3345798 RepID=UPI0035D7F77C